MGEKKTRVGQRKRTRITGRPRVSDGAKKRSVSISITPFQLQTLDAIATMDNCSRSEVLQALIEGAGFLKAGIIDGSEIKKHISTHQNWRGPRSGKMACNPNHKDGRCQNSACEAIYDYEGLL